MPRYLPILLAVCLAVTGFAATAQGGVKRQYSHAYYSAAHRCGSKNAVGRNVRRESDTLSNGKKVTPARYRVLTARLDSQCRPVAVKVTHVSPQGAGGTTPVHTVSTSEHCSGIFPGRVHRATRVRR
jgi:hypothetical protein